MLNIVRFDVTTAFFFFHFCQTLDALLKLVCDQHDKEQKKALRKIYQEKHALAFCVLFTVAWTWSAYAHAQNRPPRLTRCHRRSLDPLVDLFTDIKCLQANPFAVCFAAYCSRYATDTWGGSIRGGANKRLSRLYTFLVSFKNVLPFYYYSKAAFCYWLPKIT